MADWMKNSNTTDVQKAIDSQAIQTALEKFNAPTDDPNYGFPLAIKMVTDTTTLGGSTALAAQLYDRVAYNYGGYSTQNTGAFLSTVVIPNPGIYEVVGQSATIANSQSFASYIYINGAATGLDGIQHGFQSGGGATLINPVWQVKGVMRLKAGDSVVIMWSQPTGVIQNGIAGYHWMTVTRLLGRS